MIQYPIFHKLENTSNVQANVKRKLKEKALWQFKSHQREVFWNIGNRTTGLEGTFRGSSSFQINLDLKEPRWLLTSLPQKPIPTFNHPNQGLGIKQHCTFSDKYNTWKDLQPKADQFSLCDGSIFSSSFLLNKTMTDTHSLNQDVLQT